MGLSDRDYARQSAPGIHLTAPQSATVKLMIVTFGVYVLQHLFDGLTRTFSLKADWFERPWEAYQLLTYGFLHSMGARGNPGDAVSANPPLMHIIANMFGLWFFGRELERRLGQRRFVVFYLLAIVFAGLVWSGVEYLRGVRLESVIGASGGVTAIVILFAIYYPHVQMLFMMLFPMPMWVLGLLYILLDVQGAIAQSGNTAFTCHLGGAAFAAFFYKTNWLPGGAWLSGKKLSLRPRPKLRVHEPDEDDDANEDELSQRVDDILRKIQEKGQDSLSWNERRILERASREYKQKRH